MKPTEKAEPINELIADVVGHDRRETIKEDVCLRPPIGCGGPATEFKDTLSRREFAISGLCQKCQDSVFGGGDE